MSMRFVAAINKPGYNPYGQTVTTYAYNLFMFGTGSFGRLGLGNTTNYSSPKQVGTLTTWVTISCGDIHAGSVKSDGTLWMWGYNGYGQLGSGNTTSTSSPVQIGALTNWASVSCGGDATLATKTDGTLWSWGRNNDGKLGLGNRTDYSSPKQVGSLTNWSQIYCHRDGSTVSIKTDGTLWTWGYNNNGELGLNNRTAYSSPKQVGALTTWAKASSGALYMLATQTNGTLWAWGSGTSGQLGQGNTTSYSSPKQVGALTTWSKVTTSDGGSLAIKTDGTLWSWGANASGQLASGNVTSRSSPVQVGALTTWSYLALGGVAQVLAITTGGTLWVWGKNTNGGLGLNNRTSYSSPKQVGSSTTWIAAAGGDSFSGAIG